METSKYDTQARRDLKLEQRSPAYRALQQRTAEQRLQLEMKLRARNMVIARLRQKLVEVGCSEADIEKLVAIDIGHLAA